MVVDGLGLQVSFLYPYRNHHQVANHTNPGDDRGCNCSKDMLTIDLNFERTGDVIVTEVSFYKPASKPKIDLK